MFLLLLEMLLTRLPLLSVPAAAVVLLTLPHGCFPNCCLLDEHHQLLRQLLRQLL